MGEQVKFQLSEEEIPTSWVNLLADLPGDPPPPPLSPATGEPVGPDDLAPIFPMGLIEQEVSTDPDIAIPDEVRDIYRLWRPTPLLRARRLERELDTPAHIYYKYEGVSPAGSHKPNTAVAQAFYNREAGIKKISTETGAGQWGSAMALACQLFGLECEVFMVGISYDQKPYRKAMIETWGGDGAPQPLGADRGRPLAGRARVRQPRDRDLRGRRGGRRRRGHELLARLGAQPRLPASDRDRPGVHQADGAGRGVPGRRRSAASAAARTSPGSPIRSCASGCARGPRRGSWAPSPPPARR